jgi:hypothetical protein
MTSVLKLCLPPVFCVVLLSASCLGQTGAPATGTVTGHVTCGDTQRPAKFAHVVLFGVPAQLTEQPKADPDADLATQMTAMAGAFKTMATVKMVQTQTGTDGSYVANDVAPGDYYLFATASGYITPTEQVTAAMAAGADLKKPLPGVPMVHVAADGAATGDVTMERGAAVSGSVLWDDGSPVTGAVMAAISPKGEQKPPQQFNLLGLANVLGGLSITDDLGHFRLSGLMPGDYLVKATIQAGQQSSLGGSMNLTKMAANTPLVVYAPAAFHQADAKAVTLHTAEDLRDQLVTLKLAGLHSVSGRIAAAETHRGINSATVRIQSEQDKEFVRSAAVDEGGNYTVTYLPPGAYTLKVSDAEDTEPVKKDDKKPKLFAEDKTLRSYLPGKMSVIVSDSDVTGQNLELALDKNPKKEPDFSKMFDDEAKP